ncbi:putative mitochondrial protein AtMg00820 [Bidens hawaiensis]|uniref:putative mitochondrial protein AtMg00820 n=1 Tax=Bidens hawaiensis TaxID=980011 RepID=UPI00404B0EBE
MVTLARSGITKPINRLNLHTTTTPPTLSPLPKTYALAWSDSHWRAAIHDEFTALQKNNTWDLVPRPIDHPVIQCMWLFHHKFKYDISLDWYKAHFIVNGKSQTVGVDCDDTFSPVVKPATIRTVLSLAVSRNWPINQLDVKKGISSWEIRRNSYMHQPPSFVDRHAPGHVYSKLLRTIIQTLSREFAMSDLGLLHHFLGIAVTRDTNGLFLSQAAYVKDIIARAGLTS